MKALRFDTARIDATRRDQNGYLEVDAAVTRTGVFVYRHPDGTTTRELRHPDEVFKAESLATLRNRPVTFGHPTQEAIPLLDSKNTKKYSVGAVIGDVAHDDRIVSTKLLIMDEDVINKALDTKKPIREVSAGYQAEVIPKEGVYNGERYDHVMTNIRYNHVAIVPRGRAGADVGLRLDAADGVMVDEESDEFIKVEMRPAGDFDQLTTEEVTDPQPGIKKVVGALKNPANGDGRVVCQQYQFCKDEGWTIEKANEWVKNHASDSAYTDSTDHNRSSAMSKIKIRRDAVATKSFKADAFEINLDGTPESAEKAIDALNVRNDSAIEHIRVLEDRNSQLQGKLDAMGEAGRVSAKQLDALVKERTDACGAAHYLGVKNYNALETDQIKRLVVMKAFPNIRSDEAADPKYVEGRYDAVVDRIRQENKNLESLANLKDVAENPALFGVDRNDESVDPRAKLSADTADMWKGRADRAA